MPAAVFERALPARSSNASGSSAAAGTVTSEDGQRCRQRVLRPAAGPRPALADDLGPAGGAWREDGADVEDLDAAQLVAAAVKRDERVEARPGARRLWWWCDGRPGAAARISFAWVTAGLDCRVIPTTGYSPVGSNWLKAEGLRFRAGIGGVAQLGWMCRPLIRAGVMRIYTSRAPAAHGSRCVRSSRCLTSRSSVTSCA